MIEKCILPVQKCWFQTQKSNQKQKTTTQHLTKLKAYIWHALEGKWDSDCDTWYKPEQGFSVKPLQEGICQRPIWDVFIWHDWFC